MIDEIFHNAMAQLSEDDRRLPQVENVLPLLRRGLGIHHGGLLPILKEVIEILFGEGLIKVRSPGPVLHPLYVCMSVCCVPCRKEEKRKDNWSRLHHAAFMPRAVLAPLSVLPVFFFSFVLFYSSVPVPFSLSCSYPTTDVFSAGV